MNMFSLLKKSYLNTSGTLYDADFISLAQIEDDALSFDERTLFLSEDQKRELNTQEIKAFDEAVYITCHKGVYSVVCDLDIDWYVKGHIKTHELVIPDTVQGMLSNFDDYNAECSPVMLVHDYKIDFSKIIADHKASFTYEYDDLSVWVYTKDEATLVLEYLKNMKQFYVADGHHRLYATSLSEKKRSVSVVLMDIHDLNIKAIDRVIEQWDEDTFVSILETMKVKNILVAGPLRKGVVSIEYKGTAYFIKLSEVDGMVGGDVYGLNTQVLSYYFRIFNSNKLLYFVDPSASDDYMNKHQEAVRLRTYPMTIEAFIKVVGSGQILPPKSTFFDPKLPSFLVFKEYKHQ